MSNKTKNLTPEEAIEILKGEGDNVSIVRRVNAHKMGAEAIERCMIAIERCMIAKKPDREIRDGLCTEYICPKCKVEIDDIIKPSYCEWCGQKLDWSDVE